MGMETDLAPTTFGKTHGKESGGEVGKSNKMGYSPNKMGYHQNGKTNKSNDSAIFGFLNTWFHQQEMFRGKTHQLFEQIFQSPYPHFRKNYLSTIYVCMDGYISRENSVNIHDFPPYSPIQQDMSQSRPMCPRPRPIVLTCRCFVVVYWGYCGDLRGIYHLVMTHIAMENHNFQ